MTKRQWERFDWLVSECHWGLAAPRGSLEIRRGDMRAIIAAYELIQEFSHKEDLAHDAKVLKAEGRV